MKMDGTLMASKPWLQTFSGRQYCIEDPDPKQIHIYDIAHALSNSCRFNGQCKSFYSIAEHSTLCAKIALDIYKDVQLAQYMLLHDASEAYVCDIPRGLKILIGKEYTKYETIAMETILPVFGLSYKDYVGKFKEKIKLIDDGMLMTEKDLLMVNNHPWDGEKEIKRYDVRIQGFAPEPACVSFLNMYRTLFGEPQ